MTTYTMPSLTPNSVKWELVGNTQQFKSPFSGRIQTATRPGSYWQASLTYKALSAGDRASMMAFLASLEGMRHRFTLEYHGAPQLGILTGTPLVDGAGQTGNTLVTDGWTNSQTGIIKAGDMFSVGGELKMCTADANSGATTGPATISFVPALRVAPADNAAITVTNPTGTFMLQQNSASWGDVPGILSSFSFNAIEAIT